MQKPNYYLEESLKGIKTAHHMAYVTYPLVDEKKILLKILGEIHKSIIYSVYSLYSLYCPGHNLKNINSSSLAESRNIQNFLIRISLNKYLNNEQICKIKEIIEIHAKHNSSAMEFVKNDNLIILSDDLNICILNIYKIKEYLLTSKELFRIAVKCS